MNITSGETEVKSKVAAKIVCCLCVFCVRGLVNGNLGTEYFLAGKLGLTKTHLLSIPFSIETHISKNHLLSGICLPRYLMNIVFKVKYLLPIAVWKQELHAAEEYYKQFSLSIGQATRRMSNAIYILYNNTLLLFFRFICLSY